jgi:hypothetical protein
VVEMRKVAREIEREAERQRRRDRERGGEREREREKREREKEREKERERERESERERLVSLCRLILHLTHTNTEIPTRIFFDEQNILKREVQLCLSHVTKVKIWIQLNIPKVEDGNNFGVSIQEETVNELSRAEDTSFSLLDSMNKYLMTRAKLVSRVIKYPGLRDYTVWPQNQIPIHQISGSYTIQSMAH